jgi:uncharacterized protein YcfJ
MYTIIQQNCANIKQKSQKIMGMNVSAVWDKAKPDKDNISGLNLTVVELTNVQVTMPPL